MALTIGLTTLFLDQAVARSDESTSGAASSTPGIGQRATDKRVRAKASWYGPGFQGHKTSTGETFDQNKLTAAAASSKLPLGSTAEVQNLQNGRKVDVKINDCGPKVAGRQVDLSSSAAKKLEMKHSGVVPVAVKVLHKPPDPQSCTSK
jgi:rare lipoprotein A